MLQDRLRVQVIHWDVKEPLELGIVKIHGDDVVCTSSGQQVGNKRTTLSNPLLISGVDSTWVIVIFLVLVGNLQRDTRDSGRWRRLERVWRRLCWKTLKCRVLGQRSIIQKAYEVLMDPTKRQQFDSVDEGAEVAPPAPKTSYDFFEAWGPFFEAEARFSKKQPVPQLGGLDATKPEVENFYNFWYKFDSWRTFEFLDEDVPDDSSNRDHKRYVERKNVAARKKAKTEDNRRLLELVERAFKEDPRMKFAVVFDSVSPVFVSELVAV